MRGLIRLRSARVISTGHALIPEPGPRSLQHLGETRLRQAVLSCCQRHPLAHARLTRSPQGETSYRWDFADEVDLDPFRVADCPDSAALDRLRTELYSPPIALDTTPGFRVVLARRPSGDLVLLSASTSSQTRLLWRRSLAVLIQLAGWSDQDQVDAFSGDLGRAARCQQCVGKFLTAVGLREPPRGGIDKGKALHCGELRLTFTQDCHGGQACRLGMTRVPRGDHTIGSSPQPSTAAANSRVRDSSSSSRCGRVGWWKIRDADVHSCSTRATDRARQGASRSTTLGDSWPSRTSVPPSRACPVDLLTRIR